MPSPFPGVDPFFEREFDSGDLRLTFIVTLSEFLNARLPDGYVSRISERTYTVEPDFTLPDRVKQKPRVASRTPARIANTRFLDPYKERFVEIRKLPDGSVVTVIEALCPGNKCGGRGQYLERRQLLLRSPVNIVEIDLSRKGSRPLFEYEFVPNSYCFLLSRFVDRPFTEIFEWSVKDAIPAIAVPLLPDDEPIELDVGKVLQTVRERGRYDPWVDYTTAPADPQFDGEDRAWVQKMAGLASGNLESVNANTPV